LISVALQIQSPRCYFVQKKPNQPGSLSFSFYVNIFYCTNFSQYLHPFIYLFIFVINLL